MNLTKNTPQRLLAFTIFSSRWLQAPLYVGLIIVQCAYLYEFIKEIVHLFMDIGKIAETDVMLVALGLIDVVMISNLLIMVIIGGYETFVSRLKMDEHPDSPEWLTHVNANTMKIKLALALIGISSIHLLKTFINIHKIPDREIFWQVVIHSIFLLSAFFLAYTSKVSQEITHAD
ncbi:TIGR00645 family protein [Candidatus Paracaedibacter symbiosus]|uniref:TIGR00645 family protein n=1 Tax=Candidatus Paracaedibacter symbiosus TaxID=244582 RepID=UPI0005096000|nr:TIGR00645 family protein [Candidatus Paracaedibacter symbiosus]